MIFVKTKIYRYSNNTRNNFLRVFGLNLKFNFRWFLYIIYTCLILSCSSGGVVQSKNKPNIVTNKPTQAIIKPQEATKNIQASPSYESSNVAWLKLNLLQNYCLEQTKCKSKLTAKFYRKNNYHMVWSDGGELSPMATQLIEILANSSQDGLDPKRYKLEQIRKLINQPVATSSQANDKMLSLDLLLTDAALLYFNDMLHGATDYPSKYPWWHLSAQSVDSVALLNTSLRTHSFDAALTKVTPQNIFYTNLKSELANYQQHQSGMTQLTVVKSGKLSLGAKNSSVYLLQRRLALTNEISSQAVSGVYDLTTKQALLNFQRLHNLNQTGQLDKNTLKELNVSLSSRVKQIQSNMDRMRYLPNNLGDNYVLVNIPDFKLNVYQNNQSVLDMGVVVGKSDTKSCVLSSDISRIDINPYWGVPISIANKEIFPKLESDPTYLVRHNMRLFNSSLQEVDPSSINFSESESLKGLFIRQDPGNFNALGSVKFIFNNTCGIYLHDTNDKNSFSSDARGLSHGCIRLAKPLDLAQYILSANDSSWGSKKIKDTIATHKLKSVLLSDTIKVYIIYATTWVDNNGELHFAPDIYHVDNLY